jgi:hypothetical protein
MTVDFGTELSCTNDIAGDSRMVSGFRVVGEAIYRRWITPRGRLIGYPNYGTDLTQYVNDDMGPKDIDAMCADLETEALKDERVTDAVVTATLDNDGLLTVVGVFGTGQGPFTLTVAASDVTVTLLEIT